MQHQPAATRRPRRLDVFDITRGIALLAMAVYHLSWDLSWFSLVDWRVSSDPAWRGFAISIAASFLFLAGVSLALAHENGIRWRPALWRIARIALAAAAISVGTYFVLGDEFVRFGILHAIAAGSLVALPFVLAPPLPTLAAALAVFLLPRHVAVSFPGDQWLMWTGLTEDPPLSVDYVPLFPWLAAILAGIAAVKLLRGRTPWSLLAGIRAKGAFSRTMAFAGRHSMIVYLLHQPILFGSVWAVVALGLVPDASDRAFLDQCAASCSLASEADDCTQVCSCTLDAMRDDGSWGRLLDAPRDPALNDLLSQRYGACAAPFAPSAPTD
ncbi:DUF1624 domain-containing protein [Stappia sp. ES.058]|uniref:DUF1624 domain-containing protein n=1 Tax=Stappia sp. ES.058 TaxID=1881061 RepID=UPI00087B08F4|nr:heparan-alpha-glucosaminide N-acetyltransferase [Stappia sp. ES.058]SDU28591.1 Uncharacterized membrane protein [Stappia sp. ES.058]